MTLSPHALYCLSQTHAGSGDGKEIPMHQTAHPRFRILVSSLLLGLVSILAAAASVLADGGGGSFPR